MYKSQGLNITIYIHYLKSIKAMKSQDFRSFKLEILIYTIYMKSRLQEPGFQHNRAFT